MRPVITLIGPPKIWTRRLNGASPTRCESAAILKPELLLGEVGYSWVLELRSYHPDCVWLIFSAHCE